MKGLIDMNKNVDLKAVEAKAAEYNFSEADLTKAIKAVQSRKCNLKKKKFLADYEVKMAAILAEEEVLKEAKNLVAPREKFVTDYTLEDVKELDYERTMRAIKSIQSATCNNQGDPEKYEKYKNIEAMLLEHKAEVKPLEDGVIRKNDLRTVIEAIRTAGEVSTEKVLEMLENLM